MTAPVLLSLGSINADFQMEVARPLGAETLPARHFTRLCGGKAANRAFLARRLGLPARLLGRVGDDELRHQALGGLREAGVDLSGVGTAPGCATAVSVIAVPPGGKKAILLAANANDSWGDAATTAAVEAVGAAPDGSLLAVDCEIPAAVVRAAVERARARGFRVVLDPSWPDRVERDLLPHCLAVAPNAAEAGVLAGTEVTDLASAVEAARRIAALGPALTAVKLEDGGCILLEHGQQPFHIPAQPVDVVDTTGAGDAFTAALAVALLEGCSPRDAALFAVSASHAAVTAWGSQPAYPDRAAVESRLPALSRAARFWTP